MKIFKSSKYFFLITLLCCVNTVKADVRGSMTLTLIGVVDLTKNPDPNTPQYVQGILTGSTSMTVRPAYGEWAGGNSGWGPLAALVGLGSDDRFCYEGRDIFKDIPGNKQSQKGIVLNDIKDPTNMIYMTPTLNYQVTSSALPKDYYGTFFAGNPNGMSRYSDVCLYPDDAVEPGRGKVITVTNSSRYPIYVSKTLKPGIISYNGKPLYVVTQGRDIEASGSLQLNVVADLRVIRVCQVSNVTNNVIDVAIPRSNEIIRESNITFSCTGDGNPINISAIAVTGHPDPAEPSKLILDKVGGGTVKNPPWVLGKPFVNGISPDLSCQNVDSSKLLKFNNTDLELPLNAKPNNIENIGIKWAICAKDDTTPGQYTGKTYVTIYTKI